MSECIFYINNNYYNITPRCTAVAVSRTYLGGLAGGWKCAEEDPLPDDDLDMACDVMVGFLKDAAAGADPPPDAGDSERLDDGCCWPTTAAAAAWWCDLAPEPAVGYDDVEWWPCIMPAAEDSDDDDDDEPDDDGGGGAGLGGMPAMPQLNTRSKNGLASSNEPNWLWISWLCSSSFASSTWNTRGNRVTLRTNYNNNEVPW